MLIDFIANPVELKARAFLDARRGGSRTFRYPTVWLDEATKLCPPTKVPDISWGTNCTPERWSVGQGLRPLTFAVWLWLLDQEVPLSITKAEIGAMAGNQTSTAVKRLSEEGLIAASIPVRGNGTLVYRVYEKPNAVDSERSLRYRVGCSVVKSPEGRVHYIPWGKMGEFCRRHDLHKSPLSRVIDGYSRSYRGWTSGVPNTRVRNYEKRSGFLVSPSGEIFEIRPGEAEGFSRSRNLHPTSVRHLLAGKIGQVKGWRLVKP